MSSYGPPLRRRLPLLMLVLVTPGVLLLLWAGIRPLRAASGIQSAPLIPSHTVKTLENQQISSPVPLSTIASWASGDNDNTQSIAWGDVDGDGDLDLAVGNWGKPNKIYFNVGGVLQTPAGWSSADLSRTTSIAWGDVDGDGDLDLAVGNDAEPDQLFVNSNGVLQAVPSWSASGLSKTTGIAWGDVDGDGDLDLAVAIDGEANLIYHNDGGALQTNASWSSADADSSTSLAWGDVDNDGDLDLAVGNSGDFFSNPGQPNKIYFNEPAGLATTAGWVSNDTNHTTSVAWGDINGDGFLELAAGNWGFDNGFSPIYESNIIYLNQNGVLTTAPLDIWTSGDQRPTRSVIWGDVDGDGDLDLATGNFNISDGSGGITNKSLLISIHINQAGSLTTIPAWESADAEATYGLAWGDVDGDGDLDLAASNADGANKVYLNSGAVLENTASWQSSASDETRSVAWGDVDGDGDLDLAIGNVQKHNFGDGFCSRSGDGRNKVLQNLNGQLVALWASTEQDATLSVAWGDVDNDGDLDLAVGNAILADPTCNQEPNTGDDATNKLYLNQNGMLQAGTTWSTDADESWSVAWGDVDNDGDLDLAVGNDGQSNKVYLNDNGNLSATPWWETSESDPTRSIAWGDVDGDGDLDLAVGNYNQENRLYLNQDGTLDTTPAWSSTETDFTYSVAWGDVDGDGDLDLAAGSSGENRIYVNENGKLNPLSEWSSGQSARTRSIAWGDADGDGDLDLAAGNYLGENRVYLNTNSMLGNAAATTAWSSTEISLTWSIAWGDIDGDGDLDLAAGNSNYDKGCDCDQGAPNNLIYTSGRQGTAFLVNNPPMITVQRPITPAETNFYSPPPLLTANVIPVAFTLTDFEGDSIGRLASFYSFNGGGQWFPAVATGDTVTTNLRPGAALDFDGLNDQVIVPDDASLHLSNNLTLEAWVRAVSVSGEQIIINKESSYEFAFRNGTLQYGLRTDPAGWAWIDTGHPIPLNEWVHVALTYDSSANAVVVYANGIQVFSTPGNLPLIPFNEPLKIGNRSVANSPFAGQIDEVKIWNITRSAVDIQAGMTYPPAPNEAGLVGYWPFDEGGGTTVFDRSAHHNDGTLGGSPNSEPVWITHAKTYLYQWDTFASGFFGQSNNVVMRFVAYPQPEAGTGSGFTYTNTVPGPYQRPFASATTFPFQVRGTQVQVISGTVPLENAQVYRLGAGQSRGAGPLPAADQPLVTAPDGFLPGRGHLGLNDQIIALYPVDAAPPVTFTDKISLYLTSAVANVTGLDMQLVSNPGVQVLTVNPQNKLLLLNLDVALEWDARRDPEYLNQLEGDLRRASEILFDLTNGRFALGDIRLFQGREFFHDADIVILASNDQRPSAALGGIVTGPMDETLQSGDIVRYAFLPGQVRMGATWNRYGSAGGTLGEDWPRALAHELGHYALFELDNYIGVSGSSLIATDCQGSAMTDAYRQDYSEFLLRSAANDNGYFWNKPGSGCAQTLAEQTTGRSDWETITTFYPFLAGDEGVATTGTGPAALPLALTRITRMPVSEPDNTLTAPFFYLEDAGGSQLALQPGKAQAYLFKTQGTASPADDVLVHLGTPNGPLVNARGAAPGDRLCIYDDSLETALRVGCLSAIQPLLETLTLHEIAGWQPRIEVSPITSTTLGVTVTQAAPGGQLRVQILPSFRPTTTVQAVTATLSSVGGNQHAAELPFPMSILHGHVRVWEEGSSPVREVIQPFFITVGWNGSSFVGWSGNSFVGWSGNSFSAWSGNQFVGWSGNSFSAWSGNSFSAWSAPVTGPDGQVKIYNVADVLGLSPPSKLETLATPPALPGWLTPVGQTYSYQTSGGSGSNLVIQFQYLSRDLGPINEADLRVYHFNPQAATWQRLPTVLDAARNLASADMPGDGLYTLVATVQLPPFQQGWNQFGYPLRTSRPVSIALASLGDTYTTVSYFDLVSGEWKVYDQTVPDTFASLVNSLVNLDFGRAYWLYATQPITPYIGVDGTADRRSESNFGLPPAIYYGSILPGETAVAAGDSVEVFIGQTLCGRGRVANHQSGLAYVVHVAANSQDGCGVTGRPMVFKINGAPTGANVLWDNTQAHLLPLQTTDGNVSLYLPFIRR